MMKHLPVFREFINESRSRYDSLTRELVSGCMNEWVAAWRKNKASHTYYNNINDRRSGLVFDLECKIDFKGKGFSVSDKTGANSDASDPDTDPFIVIEFQVERDWLPEYWSEIYMHLSDVMRHEIEHITQDGWQVGNYRANKPDEDDQVLRDMIHGEVLPRHMYLTLPKEIDANLQGLRYEAKKRKESLQQAINRYLDTQDYLTDETRERVLNVWRKRAKEIGITQQF